MLVQVSDGDLAEVATMREPTELESWVLVMVPEAEYMNWDEALKLAEERNAEAAGQMALDYAALAGAL